MKSKKGRHIQALVIRKTLAFQFEVKVFTLSIWGKWKLFNWAFGAGRRFFFADLEPAASNDPEREFQLADTTRFHVVQEHNVKEVVTHPTLKSIVFLKPAANRLFEEHLLLYDCSSPPEDFVVYAQLMIITEA